MAPLGQGKINEIYDDEVLQYIIDRYHKTVRQVVLRFQIQSGMVIIPKTTHIERMKENLEMFDNEMEILRALDKGQPLIGNPKIQILFLLRSIGNFIQSFGPKSRYRNNIIHYYTLKQSYIRL